MLVKRCRGYEAGGLAPHDEVDDLDHFGPGKNQCRSCYAAYAADWKASRGGTPTKRTRKRSFDGLNLGGADRSEIVTDDDLAGSRSHEYVPDPELVALWHSIVTGAKAGTPPDNLMFLGPSGSGKTDGAAYLAALVGLPFVKVDAASMTDSESWFGTREVVTEDGSPVTVYRPSSFVEALGRPGVLLIDEVNRVRDDHRNVLIPLLDTTRRVTNPLTGGVVVRDPLCFVIMSGNRGLQFTGTYAVDPAFMSRSLVVNFDYAPADVEVKIATQSSGVDEATADLLVRFANETRIKSKNDPDVAPVSTREVMAAARLVAGGLSPDLAVRFAVMNGSSDEGGTASVRATYEVIWAGVRRPTDSAAERAQEEGF
jgi:nitric oxide reductase NorQ protein